jgi:putative DNA primase/helicase
MTGTTTLDRSMTPEQKEKYDRTGKVTINGKTIFSEIVWSIDKGWKSVVTGRHDDELAAGLALPYPDGIGDKIRYDHMRKRWLIWNGSRWEPDAKKDRHVLVRERLKDWLIGADTPKEVQDLSGLLNVSKQEKVLEALATMAPVQMAGTEFDANPNLLGVLNGVVDLTACELRKGQPEDLISQTTSTEYDPFAECPLFDKFMLEITSQNPKMVNYILLTIGAAMFGHTEPQQFYVWIGGGNNGKGVLHNVVGYVLGDYTITPSRMLYMRSKHGEASSSAPRTDLIQLMGKRFAHMSEPGGGYFNEDLLKEHTGGDTINARDSYATADGIRTFQPTHTPFFRTNDAPKLEDLGISMRRRLRVVPFRQDFSKSPDFNLETKLKAEAKGILALLVAKAYEYYQNPASINDLPEEVRQESAAYIEENDETAPFVRDECTIEAGAEATFSALYDAYGVWVLKQQDPSLEKASTTLFGKRMGQKFTREDKPVRYKGIRLNNQVNDQIAQIRLVHEDWRA